jgi:3-hydroxyisobutyrate dehydrogenase-like beta-hydroxyacid dehydrogenase
MRIAFLGLGGMGLAMARNIADSPHELTVWNRTRERTALLEPAAVAASPGEAAAVADVIITMLADDAAVGAVTFGPQGVLDNLPPGAIHACMGTISAQFSARLATVHAERGQRYLAAPVFGRPEAAAQRKLWVIVAGDAGALRTCRPVFELFAQEVIEAGTEAAHASVLKLAGNFVLLSMVEALAESYALVQAHGVDVQLFHDFIAGRLFGSPRYEAYGARIASEEYEPAGFLLAHGLKDTRYALLAADAASFPAPLASLLHDRLLMAVNRGWAESDVAALGRLSRAELPAQKT